MYSKPSEQPNLLPLSLKYKPRSLDEVVGRDDIVNSLNCFIKQNHVPNLFLCGKQGTGKTLIADLFIRRYLGNEYKKSNILILDASKDNDVKNIRDNIVSYLAHCRKIGNRKMVLWLEEADYLSKASQATLRRPIEKAMTKCLVIMTANYLDNIIDPLQSRFTGYTFGSIAKKPIYDLIKRITDNEGINIEGNFTKLKTNIYEHGKGEIRFILNNYMEHARAQGVLNQSIIDLVYKNNIKYIDCLLSGKIDVAIETAMNEPRGSLSFAIEYILKDDEVKLPYEGKIKLSNWFYEALADITKGVPYSTAILYTSHKVHFALNKHRRKLASE